MECKIYPSGICQCGCGKQTGIATRSRNGYRKGENLSFLRGHIGRLNAIAIYEAKLKVGKGGLVEKKCTLCKIHKPAPEGFNEAFIAETGVSGEDLDTKLGDFLADLMHLARIEDL